MERHFRIGPRFFVNRVFQEEFSGLNDNQKEAFMRLRTLLVSCGALKKLYKASSAQRKTALTAIYDRIDLGSTTLLSDIEGILNAL